MPAQVPFEEPPGCCGMLRLWCHAVGGQHNREDHMFQVPVKVTWIHAENFEQLMKTNLPVLKPLALCGTCCAPSWFHPPLWIRSPFYLYQRRNVVLNWTMLWCLCLIDGHLYTWLAESCPTDHDNISALCTMSILFRYRKSWKAYKGAGLQCPIFHVVHVQEVQIPPKTLWHRRKGQTLWSLWILWPLLLHLSELC